MTAPLLVFGAALVGALWFYGNTLATRRAVADPRARGFRLTAAAGVFALFVLVSLAAGASGVLGRFDRFPPPVAGFLALIVAASFAVAFSRLGDALVDHVPLAGLIGFQAFRVVAEAVLYVGHHEGLAPVQMTFEGYNFDVVTGLTAIPVALLVRGGARRGLAYAWNVMGVAMLVVIAFLAMTSMPTPMRLFAEDNTWVTRAPYSLLPGVLVSAAITGHVLAFRKLRRAGSPAPAAHLPAGAKVAEA